ncbi:MAG: hypothetical protein LBI48_00690 [Burkholderiaceae bacterium]|jgi:hypothetical protein|nr:hypothetical protein [Burkholderiaceae bacterium]
MKLATYTQQPVEVKDYDIDYREWLAPMGDRIASVTHSIRNAPDGALLVDSSTFSIDHVKLWVRGGTDGARYEVEVTVTTEGGRTDQSELVFKVKEI